VEAVVVTEVSDVIREQVIRRVIVEESKTVAQLLLELDISKDHVVLVNGERVALDFVLKESDRVAILPKIAGG
jgi:sulfur carrier protein ThiS